MLKRPQQVAAKRTSAAVVIGLNALEVGLPASGGPWASNTTRYNREVAHMVAREQPGNVFLEASRVQCAHMAFFNLTL